MEYVTETRAPCDDQYLGPTMQNVCPGTQFLTFMIILESFLRRKRKVSQLCERVKPKFNADDKYDFIVVGGGAAGAVVASRLSEQNRGIAWKVLILEAGIDEPPGTQVPSMVGAFLGTEIDWQFNTENESTACLARGGSCSWPRGKNLGGTTAHNGMMYMRGHPADYDIWQTLGNPGWSFKDVLPYFKKSENNMEIKRVGHKYHSKGGLLTVRRFPHQPKMIDDLYAAAAELGYPKSEDLNGDQIVGFTVAQATNKDGVRVSSASAFLRPFRDRENLHIVLNATVTKILINGTKAYGVQYMKNGRLHSVEARKEIVLSGGAVGSPHLLLLSGIGPKKHLQSMCVKVVKDLPGVGENLHDHVSFSLTFALNLTQTQDLNAYAMAEYLGLHQGPMASTGLSQFTGKISSGHSKNTHPDLQFFFSGYLASCPVEPRDGNPYRTITVDPVLNQPSSRGSLRLASRDPLVKPIITANYLKHPKDSEILLQGINFAMYLIGSKAFAKYKPVLINQRIPACSEYEFSSQDYWRCAMRYETNPQNHQVGSCKMGPQKDPKAVVDHKLRVHGIQGLRVADASIMPQVISGNTAAPSMMIGEKAADMIRKQWASRELELPQPSDHPQPAPSYGSSQPSHFFPHHRHPYFNVY